MTNLWITLSAAMLVLTAALHSWGGERFLLRPMFRHQGNRVLNSALARRVLRLAWHVTSASWLVLAVILLASVYAPQSLVAVILTCVGGSFAAIGLFDAIATRGRHFGWPFLLLIGVFALLAQFG